MAQDSWHLSDVTLKYTIKSVAKKVIEYPNESCQHRAGLTILIILPANYFMLKYFASG
jgi:hypothetical protein